MNLYALDIFSPEHFNHRDRSIHIERMFCCFTIAKLGFLQNQNYLITTQNLGAMAADLRA